jgi:hypothetical protein
MATMGRYLLVVLSTGFPRISRTQLKILRIQSSIIWDVNERGTNHDR